LSSKQLADKIAEQIFSKKGYDVVLLDLRKLTAIADYFVICSADSDTQVKAIADEIDSKLAEEGIKSWHIEGYRALSWILIDYVDVVVHIFKKDSREFYKLEKLWGDAPSVKVEDPLLKEKMKTTRKVSAKSSE
jgi:ribosome-associated protein